MPRALSATRRPRVLCESLLKVFPGESESGGIERPLTERLEQLGGKVEQGIPMVDFDEETHCWLALEPTPASAG